MNCNFRFLVLATVLAFVTSSDAHASTPEKTRTTLPIPGEDFKQTNTPERRRQLLSGEWKLESVPNDNPIGKDKSHPFHLLYANPTPATSGELTVQIPGVWQNQGFGMSYHGTGRYRKTFTAPKPAEGKRLWLHVEMAATLTTVTVNGKYIGYHEGAWTPFAFDVTDHLVAGDNIAELIVAEGGDHYTSGFIKNVSSSFGGVWGDVWLEERPEFFISDVHAWPDTDKSGIRIRVDMRGGEIGGKGTTAVTVSLKDAKGNEVGTATADVEVNSSSTHELHIPVESLKLWTPDNPELHEITIRLAGLMDSTPADTYTYRTGFRTTTADAERIYVNGKPIFWASILHWAVYPEKLAPFLSTEEFRKEIRELKSCGFNGINICLFMFPKRFYQVCDEEGMMLWQVYPLWFYFDNTPRPETPEQKQKLYGEFIEMFSRDRQHPSMVLRSMACEDPKADPVVMKYLVDLCHEMIPGSLAQDNNAFLNQVFADFYDMHPYEEDEVYATRMKEYVAKAKSLGAKPFLFGEGIDNDTFRHFDKIEAAGNKKPWWTDEEFCKALVAPAWDGLYWKQIAKMKRFKEQYGPKVLDFLEKNSFAHSYASRKYQIEQSRIYPVFAGLALTAIRDNICTRPGIYTELNELKWTPEELQRLNQKTMLIFSTPTGGRVYQSGDMCKGDIHLSHYGEAALENTAVQVNLYDANDQPYAVDVLHPRANRLTSDTLAPGFVGLMGTASLTLPEVTEPQEFTIQARLVSKTDNTTTNSWKIWVFPKEKEQPQLVHNDTARAKRENKILLTDNLSLDAMEFAMEGGKVIYVQHPGTRTLSAQDSPFTRDVALLDYDKDLFAKFPWDEYIDHQFFGCSSQKMFDVSDEGESINGGKSLLRMVSCRHVIERDLIVELQKGKGQIIATTLPLDKSETPTAKWLLARLVERLEK